MAQKIQLRGDTLANWTEVNPILSEREMVIETDTDKVKIGNGVDHYLDLPYFGDAGGTPTLAIETVGELTNPLEFIVARSQIRGVGEGDFTSTVGGICLTSYFNMNNEQSISQITFKNLECIANNFQFFNNQNLTRIGLPVLKKILTGSSLQIQRCSSLYALNDFIFPELISIEGNINIEDIANISTISFPKLTEIYGFISITDLSKTTQLVCVVNKIYGSLYATCNTCPLESLTHNYGSIGLTTADTIIDLNSLIISKYGINFNCPDLDELRLSALKEYGGDLILQNCKLYEPSVDNILSIFASLDGTNGTTAFTGTIDLSGGTSAPPSNAGLANKAIIEARGGTVIVNEAPLVIYGFEAVNYVDDQISYIKWGSYNLELLSENNLKVNNCWGYDASVLLFVNKNHVSINGSNVETISVNHPQYGNCYCTYIIPQLILTTPGQTFNSVVNINGTDYAFSAENVLLQNIDVFDSDNVKIDMTPMYTTLDLFEYTLSRKTSTMHFVVYMDYPFTMKDSYNNSYNSVAVTNQSEWSTRGFNKVTVTYNDVNLCQLTIAGAVFTFN